MAVFTFISTLFKDCRNYREPQKIIIEKNKSVESDTLKVKISDYQK